jgi:EAL domain-containing protein (putative c-di-GMP-specific phosphodiesterase class I)
LPSSALWSGSIRPAPRRALIARSTIDLAHSLGLKVVAEGIETNDQFSLLSAMGCDQAQGYLVARPVPLRRLFDFLNEDRQELRAHA